MPTQLVNFKGILDSKDTGPVGVPPNTTLLVGQPREPSAQWQTLQIERMSEKDLERDALGRASASLAIGVQTG